MYLHGGIDSWVLPCYRQHPTHLDYVEDSPMEAVFVAVVLLALMPVVYGAGVARERYRRQELHRRGWAEYANGVQITTYHHDDIRPTPFTKRHPFDYDRHGRSQSSRAVDP
jgi:hypothetical protein